MNAAESIVRHAYDVIGSLVNLLGAPAVTEIVNTISSQAKAAENKVREERLASKRTELEKRIAKGDARRADKISGVSYIIFDSEGIEYGMYVHEFAKEFQDFLINQTPGFETPINGRPIKVKEIYDEISKPQKSIG